MYLITIDEVNWYNERLSNYGIQEELVMEIIKIAEDRVRRVFWINIKYEFCGIHPADSFQVILNL